MLFQIEMFPNDWMRLKCHFPNAGMAVWSSLRRAMPHRYIKSMSVMEPIHISRLLLL